MQGALLFSNVSDIALSGFDVAGGGASEVVKLYCACGLSFSNCGISGGAYGVTLRHSRTNSFTKVNIFNNSSDGVYGDKCGQLSMSDCSISNNLGNGMYFLYNNSEDIYDFRNLSICSNKASGVWARYAMQNLRFKQCLFYNNGAAGVFMYEQCQHWRLENCVLHSNKTTGLFMRATQSATLFNTIACNNGEYGIYVTDPPWYFVTNDHNNVFGNVSGNYGGGGCVVGEHSISADPQFKVPGSDFRLGSMSSPCYNAGTKQTWMIGATDPDGNRRIFKGIVDIGAYEFSMPGTFLMIR